MSYRILLLKETRAGEQRVALVPSDVETLIIQGHSVFVESGAGLGAGFADEDFQAVGADIVAIDESCLASFKQAFANIDILVRAKRPQREREKLESQAVLRGTIMIGALDPMEVGSDHIAEYHKAGIVAYSLDQLKLPIDDPMNILSAMSRFAGELALKDGVAKCDHGINKVVIIGLGVVGKSALTEALSQKLPVTVIVGSDAKATEVKELGANAVVVDRQLPLAEQQKLICECLLDADVVLTAARRSGEQAPLLITTATVNQMQTHAVIVDMAISEGGNVQDSQHDEVVVAGNGVKIINESGYPKVLPKQASLLWSKASLYFITKVSQDPALIDLKPI